MSGVIVLKLITGEEVIGHQVEGGWMEGIILRHPYRIEYIEVDEEATSDWTPDGVFFYKLHMLPWLGSAGNIDIPIIHKSILTIVPRPLSEFLTVYRNQVFNLENP